MHYTQGSADGIFAMDIMKHDSHLTKIEAGKITKSADVLGRDEEGRRSGELTMR